MHLRTRVSWIDLLGTVRAHKSHSDTVTPTMDRDGLNVNICSLQPLISTSECASRNKNWYRPAEALHAATWGQRSSSVQMPLPQMHEIVQVTNRNAANESVPQL